MRPLPDDAEEVEDLLTDILSKSAMDPCSDPGGGGGDGSGGPPPLSPELWLVPLNSLQEWVSVRLMLATLTCATRATA